MLRIIFPGFHPFNQEEEEEEKDGGLSMPENEKVKELKISIATKEEEHK